MQRAFAMSWEWEEDDIHFDTWELVGVLGNGPSSNCLIFQKNLLSSRIFLQRAAWAWSSFKPLLSNAVLYWETEVIYFQLAAIELKLQQSNFWGRSHTGTAFCHWRKLLLLFLILASSFGSCKVNSSLQALQLPFSCLENKTRGEIGKHLFLFFRKGTARILKH